MKIGSYAAKCTLFFENVMMLLIYVMPLINAHTINLF